MEWPFICFYTVEMFIYTCMTDHRDNYEPAMQPREQGQARIRQNTVQRRLIELMCEENRAGVLVRDQCELQITR